MGEVRLVDLEIIKRYSLAVRQESAPAEELLAAIDASREAVAAALEEDGEPAATPKAKVTKRAPAAKKSAARRKASA